MTKKKERLARANEDFASARAIAETYGMTLVNHNGVHFSLRRGDYLLNIYPSTQRLSVPPDRYGQTPPRVCKNWRLADVVEATADWLKEPRPLAVKDAEPKPKKRMPFSECTVLAEALQDALGALKELRSLPTNQVVPDGYSYSARVVLEVTSPAGNRSTHSAPLHIRTPQDLTPVIDDAIRKFQRDVDTIADSLKVNPEE